MVHLSCLRFILETATMSSHSFRAIRIDQHGGPEQLKLVTVSVGEPGPGEIRIRHKAVGLNFIDVYQRSGLYPMAMPLQLGMEASGIVEAVGAGVTPPARRRPRRLCQPAAGRLLRRARHAAQCVCKLPDAIDFDTGAAMMPGPNRPVPAQENAAPGLRPGDFVLFHAAAGGGSDCLPMGQGVGPAPHRYCGFCGKMCTSPRQWCRICYQLRSRQLRCAGQDITAGKGVKVVYDSVGRTPGTNPLDCLAPLA